MTTPIYLTISNAANSKYGSTQSGFAMGLQKVFYGKYDSYYTSIVTNRRLEFVIKSPAHVTFCKNDTREKQSRISG